MTQKEKLFILLGLASLASRYDIKDEQLCSDIQLDKLENILKENSNLFKTRKSYENYIIGLFRKYVNNL